MVLNAQHSTSCAEIIENHFIKWLPFSQECPLCTIAVVQEGAALGFAA